MLNWIRKQLRKEDGLTLIELIVVVAIIAILAFAITPRVLESLNNSRLNSARSVANELHATMERFYVNEGAAATATYPMPAADTWASLVTELAAEFASNNADENFTGFDYNAYSDLAATTDIANPPAANAVALSYCFVLTARDRETTPFRVTPAGVEEDPPAPQACP